MVNFNNSILGLALVTAVAANPVKRQDDAVTYEAEDAVLTGTEVATDQEGYTGTGYVTGFDESTDEITFTVTSDSTALYDLSITYAGIYGDKYTTVILNGGASSQVSLPASDSWEVADGGQLLLEEGENTIEIVNNWGWYLIDSITLSPAEERPPHSVTRRLINPRADRGAYALYRYLVSIYGEKILAGQQDLAWAQWIEEQIGKFPALVSVDLMDYSPSRVEHGTNGTSIEDALEHAANGGIVSVMWHWNAPAGLYDTDEEPWWSGFYTAATDFNIADALADTTNENYTLIVRDIDAIAVQLKRLEDAHVPVIWRPLHEAEGGWFWWGAQGSAAALKLWDLLYDRLTNYHHLNNLIWEWNSIAEDWYPGDDKVDMLSADVYSQGNGPISVQYNELYDLGNDTKLIAAAEVGAAPLPDLLQAYQADWVYFCVWGDSFINNEEWNSVEVLEEIYTDDYVLTLDEIQGWRRKH